MKRVNLKRQCSCNMKHYIPPNLILRQERTNFHNHAPTFFLEEANILAVVEVALTLEDKQICHLDCPTIWSNILTEGHVMFVGAHITGLIIVRLSSCTTGCEISK